MKKTLTTLTLALTLSASAQAVDGCPDGYICAKRLEVLALPDSVIQDTNRQYRRCRIEMRRQDSDACLQDLSQQQLDRLAELGLLPKALQRLFDDRYDW